MSNPAGNAQMFDYIFFAIVLLPAFAIVIDWLKNR